MIYRNNITILDTETTGDFSTPIIYDIGWVVLDKDLQITTVKEYLVQEIFENNFIMNTAFYIGKRPQYLKRLKDGEIELKPFRAIIDELIKDMKRNKAQVLSAYNIAFDMRALYSTLQLVASDYVHKWDKFISRMKPLCIWDIATDTLLQDEEYKELAYEQGWISAKGNIQTNAEVSYRYLTGNLEFEEEHTALEDVMIEYQILKHCLTNFKGRANYGLKYGSWRKVQSKEQQEQNIKRYQELNKKGSKKK